MSGRKRPSGLGSNSRRFAEVAATDGSTVRIPVTKDVGTVIYLADENGAWPRAPHVTLLVNLAELHDGATFEMVDLRPGRMGQSMTVTVIEVRVRVNLFEGKYGQVIRSVLVTPVMPSGVEGEEFASQFMAGES